jgi:flagellar biosynthetic protein FliP
MISNCYRCLLGLRPKCNGLAWSLGLCLLFIASEGWAQAGPQLPLLIGKGRESASYSVPIQTLLFFTALSFLPALLLMMTGFTRIVIVLSLLRQALGTQSVPPNQVIVGLSLFLTFFVMGPTHLFYGWLFSFQWTWKVSLQL